VIYLQRKAGSTQFNRVRPNYFLDLVLDADAEAVRLVVRKIGVTKSDVYVHLGVVAMWPARTRVTPGNMSLCTEYLL